MPTPHLPRHVPIAATFRGGHPENVHFGSFAVVSASGEVLVFLDAGNVFDSYGTRLPQAAADAPRIAALLYESVVMNGLYGHCEVLRCAAGAAANQGAALETPSRIFPGCPSR